MKRKVSWQTRIILLLALATIIGFIPWESWFPIEIRNKTLATLTNGSLGFGALFLLSCFGFRRLLNRFKGFAQGFLFLLTPFLIIGTAVGWMICVMFPRLDWKDIALYKNGDEYLVIQRFDSFAFESSEKWRILRTSSGTGMVRWIDEQRPLNSQAGDYTKSRENITLSNKAWHKIEIDE
jgi:hypothetical protein